jgi:SAM-dependent methyltransferase
MVANIEAELAALRKNIDDNPPSPLPPVEFMKIIGSKDEAHFIHAMKANCGDIIRFTGTTRDAAILDIGCGCGRMAMAFGRYLNPGATYLGFDAWKEGVAWCNENVKPQYPNFEFKVVEADNNYYVETDTGQQNQFDLSFIPQGAFDTIHAISVFTHLKENDARQYLKMVHDSLKPEGKAYLTFFIMDETARNYVATTSGYSTVKEQYPGVWHAYEKHGFFTGLSPEKAKELIAEANLKIVEELPGKWAGRPNGKIWQDGFVLARG